MQVVIDVVGWAMIGISIAALACATWRHITERRSDGGDE